MDWQHAPPADHPRCQIDNGDETSAENSARQQHPAPLTRWPRPREYCAVTQVSPERPLQPDALHLRSTSPHPTSLASLLHAVSRSLQPQRRLQPHQQKRSSPHGAPPLLAFPDRSSLVPYDALYQRLAQTALCRRDVWAASCAPPSRTARNNALTVFDATAADLRSQHDTAQSGFPIRKRSYRLDFLTGYAQRHSQIVLPNAHSTWVDVNLT